MSGTLLTFSPTACFVDATGIHAPAFNDILNFLIGQVQGIFGSDIYLGNDSQDGQMLGVFAQAIFDTNSMAIAVYGSFSPSTAIGVGLSSVVKINGIARNLPTNSVVDLVLGGTAGTIITNGYATDENQQRWNFPSSVQIDPITATVTITAVAALPGAITAGPGSVSTIGNPTLGWQSVTNPNAAEAGAPLEEDPGLRLRQTTSTMLPSVTALDGMVGAVLAVSGVTRLQPYENDTSSPDSNGVPGHSISFVVEGGDDLAVATAIAAKKTPGAGTYGTTNIVVIDQFNVPHTINFFRPIPVALQVIIHVTALQGYSSTIGNAIVQAIVNYLNSLSIGGDVFLSKLFAVGNLSGTNSLTFNITSILIARSGGTPAEQDIIIAFNEAAVGSVQNITVSVP